MLHVLTGPACNNNCLFCMEADREGRDASVQAQTSEDVRAMIAAYPDCDEILFTSGEPTLNPQLPAYVGWARERGFRVIGLITNGRRLAYAPFLASLLQAGLNRVTVSLHGHEASLHDGLTRAPGSFEQTHAALENLARARRAHPQLRVHTSTVVNRRNLEHLTSLCDYLARSPADQMVFNVMMAKGRGALHFDRMMPRYADVVDRFLAVCAMLPQPTLARMRVVDLPPCVMALLPPGIRGALECFAQFEPLGSTGLTELAVLNPCSQPDLTSQREPHDGSGARIAVQHLDPDWQDLRRPWYNPPWLARWVASRRGPASAQAGAAEPIDAVRERIVRPEAGAQRQYYVTGREQKDAWLRAKGPPCGACSLDETCPGVWKTYVDVHGWSEFQPVPPTPEQAAAAR